MGEVIALFPVPDNLRHFPGGASIAPHPEMCGHADVPEIPEGVIVELGHLMSKGRITDEEMIETLEFYALEEPMQPATAQEPDPNQLELPL